MKLKAVPPLVVVLGMLLVPNALARNHTHMVHPNPVPNSHHVNPT